MPDTRPPTSYPTVFTLSSLLQLLPEPALLVDMHTGKIVDANTPSESLTGRSRSELLELDEAALFSIGKNSVNSLSAGRLQLRHSDGSTSAVSVSSTVIPADNGHTKLILLRRAGEDHSVAADLRRTQQELRRERDRAQNYLTIAEVIIVVLNARGQVELINKKGCRILGRSEQELLGADWFSIVVPERERERTRTIFARIVSGMESSLHYFENHVLCRDGQERLIAWHNAVLLDENGRIAGSLSSGEDITERRKAEEELRESEERFRTTFEQAAVGIAHVAPDGRFLRVNQRLCDILGYSQQEMLSLRFQDITHHEDLALSVQHVGDLLNGKLERVALQKRYLRKDGSCTWGRVTVSLLRSSSGAPKYTIAVIEDITAQKHVAEERERLQQQLVQAQKMESIGRLAGGVAHDFNNLLSPIMGYAELLLQDLPAEAACRGSIREMLNAAQRARDLTRQLLTFGRQQVMQMRVVELNAVAAGFEQLLRRALREDIEVEFQLRSCRSIIKADTVQLEQILMNLAVNSQEAMPGGGKLVIATQDVVLTQHSADFGEAAPGQYVELSVTDDGCGIPDEIRPHLFEPFFTTKAMGTGLGLSTVYGIVKQHQGFISVREASGRGTVVRILFPANEAQTIPAGAPEHSPAGRGGTETVLLVEDDDMVRDLVHEMLSRRGYRVLSASHPDEALQIAAGYPDAIHVLLTDVVMPRMNGSQLFAAMSKSRSSLRVLYMSGYHNELIPPEDEWRLLQKPLTLETLTSKLRDILDSPD